MESQRSLLPGTSRDNSEDCYYEEEWSEGSSCDSCCSGSDDSSDPEWESLIEPSGELIFIDCDPVVSHTARQVKEEAHDPLAKTQARRSTRNKFLRLLRRRDSKRRSSKRPQKVLEAFAPSQDTSKVKFQDYQDGQIKEIKMRICNQESRKFARRGNQIESLLGFSVSTLSDGNRLMIAGLVPDSEAARQKRIKIGDWLKSINKIDVTYQNLSLVLSQLEEEDEVTLTLQCVAGVEVTKNPPINELKNHSNFVHHLTHATCQDGVDLSSLLCGYGVGVLFVNLDDLTETGPEFQGVTYCYPQPMQKNSLCSLRGAFITLNQLLFEITNYRPQLTTILLNQHLTHVTHFTFGNKILLLMIPDECRSASNVLLASNEVVQTLEFACQSIEKAFETSAYRKQLDNYFLRLFLMMLNKGAWPKQTVSSDAASKLVGEKQVWFEDVLPAAHLINLPSEATMQIDDALTELEASDYREWNEDPLDCQRLFTILGSAFYHSGYLLSSHFAHTDLVDVHLFCRQQGLFYLSKTEPVRTLVFWREVFPSSCNRGLPSEFAEVVPDGRRYLLVVGSGRDLLAVIMEAGGCTEPPEDNLGPDAFYVEEAQATLAHLQELGISELADRWMLTNLSQQTVVPEIRVRKKNDIIGSISFMKSSTTPTAQKDSFPAALQKKPEVTSILKRRSSDHFLPSASATSLHDDNSEARSEDSVSQGGCSERSEVSDEPVSGRRAMREKRNNSESDEYESDIEDYRACGQSNSSFDLRELRQSLFLETEEAHPVKLTSGKENVLFHYVKLDTTEGVLLRPPESEVSSTLLSIVMANFRSCSQHIHNLFQDTLRFKNMLENDKKSTINKSLIGIKEYGTLFECKLPDASTKKIGTITYWVVGRLFYAPHPREVYICYEDTIPQNIVEVAFKLGISLVC